MKFIDSSFLIFNEFNELMCHSGDMLTSYANQLRQRCSGILLRRGRNLTRFLVDAQGLLRRWMRTCPNYAIMQMSGRVTPPKRSLITIGSTLKSVKIGPKKR